ncbi:MAG: hypothetical protein VYE17_11915 [Pseudomonadota bacterium]|nr:hypothetical protein [Pseudomonadota bacterium]
MTYAAHTTASPQASQPHQEDTLPLVRERVRNILTRSQAFRSLSKDKRDQIAQDMVKVARYMVDAGGETRDVPLSAVVEPQQKAPATRALAGRDKPPLDPVGNKMGQRGEALADTINKVDFPGFVGGLIDGVFNAIVSASIDQMEAYADLVQNVAKTADQYMKDNVSEDQARDWLAERYPDHLKPDTEKGRLGVNPDADSSNPPNFAEELNLPFPVDMLDNDTVEEQLVPAARKRIAIDRQQLLLTLVLMGINRIVVSDGRISASVVFQLDTKMMAKRHWEREKSFEYNSEYSREQSEGSGGGGWFEKRWYRPKTKFSSDAHFNVSTQQDADNEDTTKLKVNLKGNVDLRFKSETFPLEKMTDMLGLNQADLEAKQARAAPPQQQAAPGLAPPPPPPLP